MKRHLSYIIAVAVCLTIGVSSHANEITMTTSKKGEVAIFMSGFGTINIDWGDGSAIETHTLSSDRIKYVYSYSDTTARTITITGNHITFLDCANNQLTFLDVSKNKELNFLNCPGNQLTSLDVSNNKRLKIVLCYYNHLTFVDVSNNTELIALWCHYNQLISLNVSKCTTLLHLACYSNQLTSLDVSNNMVLEQLD